MGDHDHGRPRCPGLRLVIEAKADRRAGTIIPRGTSASFGIDDHTHHKPTRDLDADRVGAS